MSAGTNKIEGRAAVVDSPYVDHTNQERDTEGQL